MSLPAAVFLDRDGVITVERGYVKSLSEFEMIPGSAAAVARLTQAGLPVIVVTNQAAVNRGYLSLSTLDEIHDAMTQAIEAEGGRLEAILYCPHRPDEGCECRKPKPGMLLRAAEMLTLNLTRSILIGDMETDIQAAANAGCSALQVGVDVRDLSAAVDRILRG